jgi:hypothetical protein
MQDLVRNDQKDLLDSAFRNVGFSISKRNEVGSD